MGTVAEVVHRSADGSVHYLTSTVLGSTLLITDPKVGRFLYRFDGPCRLVPRHPNLPADSDVVSYESISVTGSTRISVHPGESPSSYSVAGMCFGCAFTPEGHDYELWPVCCRGSGTSLDAGPLRSEQTSTPVVEPEPVPEPTPEPVSSPSAERRRGKAAAVEPKRKTVEPAVDPDVERGAKAIAEQVRSAAIISKAELVERSSVETVDRYLRHALDRGWVVAFAGPKLLQPGPVNHRPMTSIEGLDGPSWGPDESVGLFRTAPQRLG